MYSVGITSFTHINKKGGYTAKYLDKVLAVEVVEAWGCNVEALRERVC